MSFEEQYARWSRVGVTFRLLMLTRTLLITMTVMLLGPSRIGATQVFALAGLGVLSCGASQAWKFTLRLVTRRPLLLCVDGLVVFGILLPGGTVHPFPFFTLVTSAVAGVLYEWRAMLLVCAQQMFLYYLTVGIVTDGKPVTAVTVVLAACYPLAGCIGIALHHVLDQYAAAEETLRRAEAAAMAAEERARLARDLHDSLAKTLRGISLTAAALPAWIQRSPERAEREARNIVAAIDAATGEARGLIADRRDTHALQPLSMAVGNVVAEWSQGSGIPGRVDVTPAAETADLPISTRYEVVAILKEALENVERHAGASGVYVRLALAGDLVELTVHDDGRGLGFALEQDWLETLARHGHYGVIGMWERARRAGGDLAMWSVPGDGVTVTVSAPCA
ncbi:sensor histidine kinase [Actinoallomurus iriomotensis]|uniref:Signal transduction histidine kinase subgroup 3 dimerisation and phosphoacceptor domain-containing protein n=1 Tax=Actinoallomurus iriomotensis TaxID=478107 RepID=A0A9W6S115_9ACTN|nr:histidine kinase [Actinoallomurus iriomotensis]GLY85321.1 hypothetical protein Airi02_032500 [Actinoallomurus iriomotensis]